MSDEQTEARGISRWLTPSTAFGVVGFFGATLSWYVAFERRVTTAEITVALMAKQDEREREETNRRLDSIDKNLDKLTDRLLDGRR